MGLPSLVFDYCIYPGKSKHSMGCESKAGALMTERILDFGILQGIVNGCIWKHGQHLEKFKVCRPTFFPRGRQVTFHPQLATVRGSSWCFELAANPMMLFLRDIAMQMAKAAVGLCPPVFASGRVVMSLVKETL